MEKIFIWGTGAISTQVLEQCDVFSQYDVEGFIDNDASRVGEIFHDREIFEPNILNKAAFDRVVILTDHYQEIKEQIMQEFPERVIKVESKNFFYKQCILARYHNSHDLEILQLLDYLRENDLQVFNYDFVKKYEKINFDIQYDTACGMYFVYHEKKRLYFAKSLKTKEEVERYYRNILIEQDDDSPHKYMDDTFQVQNGDVVVDIGVAEGNFSLQIIDKVSKLYMIETDDEWIEALHETFKAYEDKVVIIKKFATSLDAGKYATLDALIHEEVHFVKMDIEGNEWDALLGAEKLIARSGRLKCAICAYHGDFDEILIKDVLVKYGMKCTVTRGYMWFPDIIRQTYISTRLCRGIVRGMKH